MNAHDFKDVIEKGLGEDERFEDAAVMVNIVADARATARRESGARVEIKDAYRFSLIVLCFLFDPVKNESYQASIRRVRLAYRNIARSEDLQAGFARSLSRELLFASNISEALQKPIENLFQLNQIFAFSSES